MCEGGSNKRFEWIWVTVILAVVCMIHGLTLARMPCVWGDEPIYSDAAVNWVRGNGFVSSGWYGQRDNAFWAANVPLYQFLLCGWLKVIGVSIVTVRLANIIIGLACGCVAWVFVRKSGLVRTSGWRLAFLGCYLCSLHCVFAARCGRPDMLTMLLVWMAAWAAIAERAALRRTSLFLVGFLFPAAGLQLGSYSVLLAVSLGVFMGRQFFMRLVPLFVGEAAGVLALLALYAGQGVLREFLVSTVVVQSSLGRKLMAGDSYVAECIARAHLFTPSVDWRFSGLWKDPGALLLGATMFAVALFGSHSAAGSRDDARRFAWFGVLVLIAIPAGIIAHAHYPGNYAWMACTPAVAAFFGMASHMSDRSGWLPKALRTVPLAAAAIGLPFVTFIAVREWSQRDYAAVDRFVAAYAAPEERIWSSAAPYYAALGRFKCVYYGNYPLTEQDRQAIRLAFEEPAAEQNLASRLGGTWTMVGDPLDCRRRTTLRLPMTFFMQYSIAAYRRIEAPPDKVPGSGAP